MTLFTEEGQPISVQTNVPKNDSPEVFWNGVKDKMTQKSALSEEHNSMLKPLCQEGFFYCLTSNLKEERSVDLVGQCILIYETKTQPHEGQGVATEKLVSYYQDTDDLKSYARCYLFKED